MKLRTDAYAFHNNLTIAVRKFNSNVKKHTKLVSKLIANQFGRDAKWRVVDGRVVVSNHKTGFIDSYL